MISHYVVQANSKNRDITAPLISHYSAGGNCHNPTDSSSDRLYLLRACPLFHWDSLSGSCAFIKDL